MTNDEQPDIQVAQKEDIVAHAELTRVVRQAPNYQSYYANDTQVQTSPWDVRLVFGLVVTVDPESKTLVVEHGADVRLSLQHAKRVAKILQQQIDQYEKRFGLIPQPPTSD